MSTRSKAHSQSLYTYSAKRNLRAEEITAYKRIGLATVLIVTILVGGYFLAVPVLVHLGSGSSAIPTNSTLGRVDKAPPAAPRLESVPDITKSRTLTITGNSEAGASVVLRVNGQSLPPTVVDTNGQFKQDITLSSGSNTITAQAKDAAGNSSRTSDPASILYDAIPPTLILTSPSDGATTDAAQIVVTGKSEADAQVVVNDRQVIVQTDGTFNTTLPITAGQNTITVVATDKAGNTTKVLRAVTMQSASASATPSTSPGQ